MNLSVLAIALGQVHTNTTSALCVWLEAAQSWVFPFVSTACQVLIIRCAACGFIMICGAVYVDVWAHTHTHTHALLFCILQSFVFGISIDGCRQNEEAFTFIPLVLLEHFCAVQTCSLHNLKSGRKWCVHTQRQSICMYMCCTLYLYITYHTPRAYYIYIYS